MLIYENLFFIFLALYKLFNRPTPRTNILGWVVAFIFIPFISSLIFLFFSVSALQRKNCGKDQKNK